MAKIVACAQPGGHLRVTVEVLTRAMGAARSERVAATDDPAPQSPVHRADYVLERGVWRVSCRVCGWEATDAIRRQLASRFRFHLRPGQHQEPAAPPE